MCQLEEENEEKSFFKRLLANGIDKFLISCLHIREDWMNNEGTRESSLLQKKSLPPPTRTNERVNKLP